MAIAAFWFDAPRASVMIATPCGPMTIHPSHAGMRLGGFAPRTFARLSREGEKPSLAPTRMIWPRPVSAQPALPGIQRARALCRLWLRYIYPKLVADQRPFQFAPARRVWRMPLELVRSTGGRD